MAISMIFPEIAHIGYIVDDLDWYVNSYKNFYGIETFSIYDYIPDVAWSNGEKLADCHLRIALGRTDTGMGVELINPVKGCTEHMLFMYRNGPGIHHIAYRVSDYNEWYKNISGQIGTRILFEADVKDEIRGRRRCFYAQIPGIMEIIEITEIGRL